MIKIKMSKLNTLVSEQLEDDLSEDLKTIIDFVKNQVIISPAPAFRGKRYNVVIITEHDLHGNFMDEIESLVKGLNGENTLIILFAYIDEADYPYPNIPDEDSYPEKAMENQAKVFENHGFIRAQYNTYYNRYKVPYIYGNEFGSKISELLDREFFPCITPKPFDVINDNSEDYIRNAYITITKSNMLMLGSLANKPAIRNLVNKMGDSVAANVSCLPITMQDKVYLFNNELLQFVRAWDEFNENTKILDDKSTAQILSIEADLITAGQKLTEAYKATCSRLTTDDFELVENFRNKLQAYVVEHAAK